MLIDRAFAAEAVLLVAASRPGPVIVTLPSVVGDNEYAAFSASLSDQVYDKRAVPAVASAVGAVNDATAVPPTVSVS